MKARMPKGYGNAGAANIQQLARQAQKMQAEMDVAIRNLSRRNILQQQVAEQ